MKRVAEELLDDSEAREDRSRLAKGAGDPSGSASRCRGNSGPAAREVHAASSTPRSATPSISTSSTATGTMDTRSTTGWLESLTGNLDGDDKAHDVVLDTVRIAGLGEAALVESLHPALEIGKSVEFLVVSRAKSHRDHSGIAELLLNHLNRWKRGSHPSSLGDRPRPTR